MKITKLSLSNFRSYKKAEFEMGDKVMVLGPNGSGKSNLLEAIYLLAVGKSFRADTDMEMIRYDQQVAIVTGNIQTGNEVVEEKITVSNPAVGGEIGTVRGSYRIKRFEINGVPRRMMDSVGRMRAVLFAPADMDLLTGSPAGRRRYLDFVLVQADREYRRTLASYEKGLRQRNKLLEQIREGMAIRQQLFFWDRLLIKNGEYITLAREKYLEKLKDELYESVYDKSIISEARIVQYENEEVAAASTLVGPHRDDWLLQYKGRDISKFGSRGEQRMALLWMKLKEREFLKTDEGELPILLLDDIFSELDKNHKQTVFEMVRKQEEEGGQVIISNAGYEESPFGEGWVEIKL